MSSIIRPFVLAVVSSVFVASLLPLDGVLARGGGRGGRSGMSDSRSAGASPRVNSSVNLQNRGNFNSDSANRGTVNSGNVNRGNVNTGNVNRGNINTGNINRGNVNVGNNVNVNTGWAGGGWYGGGYYVPPGWGLATFATGLAIGAAVCTPPPYYSTVYVGSSTYIYSDGVFLQPSGDSYVVVKPPIGAVVPSIPDGCTATDIGGVVYYSCSGIIYQPFYQGSNLVYKVVKY